MADRSQLLVPLAALLSIGYGTLVYVSDDAAGWPAASTGGPMSFSSGCLGFSSFKRLVSANELAAKCEEQAGGAEAPRVP